MQKRRPVAQSFLELWHKGEPYLNFRTFLKSQNLAQFWYIGIIGMWPLNVHINKWSIAIWCKNDSFIDILMTPNPPVEGMFKIQRNTTLNESYKIRLLVCNCSVLPPCNVFNIMRDILLFTAFTKLNNRIGFNCPALWGFYIKGSTLGSDVILHLVGVFINVWCRTTGCFNKNAWILQYNKNCYNLWTIKHNLQTFFPSWKLRSIRKW